ncbi:MAG: hypothetical protein ACXAEX_07240 [Promethearchaeota archaeon]
MDETIRAIGYITRDNYNSVITVKKIREFYRINPLDNSKINFYWRSLNTLELDGILKRKGNRSPKQFLVLNYFKFFELFHDSYMSQVVTANGAV